MSHPKIIYRIAKNIGGHKICPPKHWQILIWQPGMVPPNLIPAKIGYTIVNPALSESVGFVSYL